MPRLTPQVSPTHVLGPVSRATFGIWHVGCMVLLQGCFYVKPAWEPKPNEAPQILEPSRHDIDILKDLSLDTTLTVMAVDRDGDDVLIHFQQEGLPWLTVLPPATTQLGDGRVVYMRTAHVTDPSANLNGRPVRANVTDGQLNVPINWVLEVPQ